MTTSAAPPRVEPVLAALDQYSLLPLLPEGTANLLAGPVALAASGVTLDPGTTASVSRTLRAVAGILEPILERVAPEVKLPPLPQPVTPAQTHAKVNPPVLRVGADGRIKIEQTPYALREVCAGLPGARSVKRGGRHAWWSIPSSPAAAAAALEALRPFQPAVSNGVRELAASFAATASARARFVDGGEVPDGDGLDVVNMPLWDHQKVALGYSEIASALLLAIPMSGGKTATAVAAINRRQANRVLIVCPNKVRGVWPREVRERSAVGWHIEDGTRPARRGKGRVDLPTAERLERAQRVLYDCDCPAPTHAFVVNYEVLPLPGWRDWVPPYPFDAIIYDEIHRLKSPTGPVSKAAARLVPFSTFRLGLSGTPVPQNWWDLFGVFRALDPGIFGETWTKFKEKWAVMRQTREGHSFPDPRRSTDDVELARRFHLITYRPIVDLKLPPVQDIEREVELEPKALTVYRQISEDLWADLSEFAQRRETLDLDTLERDEEGDPEIGDAPAEISANNILTRMLRLQQLTGGILISDPIRDEDGAIIKAGTPVRVSKAKVDMLAEILDEIGCTGAASKRGAAEPVVVFCRFKTDLDAVRELAEKEGLRYAEVSGRRGDGLDADSRMTPDADVVGVQIQAGGTGVDLTRARYAIWYSLGYSVADYDQARSRLVRINQKRPVVFIHLVVPDTIDKDVYDAIDDRRSAVSSVLRNHGVDPSRLNLREPDPGPRHDSPTGGVQQAHVTLPWE